MLCTRPLWLTSHLDECDSYNDSVRFLRQDVQGHYLCINCKYWISNGKDRDIYYRYLISSSASPGIYVKLTGVKLGGRCADGLWNSRQDISPLIVATTSLFLPSRSRGDRQYELLCACRGTKWASCIAAIVSITIVEYREGWSLKMSRAYLEYVRTNSSPPTILNLHISTSRYTLYPRGIYMYNY